MSSIIYLTQDVIKSRKKNKKSSCSNTEKEPPFNFSKISEENKKRIAKAKKERDQANKHILKVYKIK